MWGGRAIIMSPSKQMRSSPIEPSHSPWRRAHLIKTWKKKKFIGLEVDSYWCSSGQTPLVVFDQVKSCRKTIWKLERWPIFVLEKMELSFVRPEWVIREKCWRLGGSVKHGDIHWLNETLFCHHFRRNSIIIIMRLIIRPPLDTEVSTGTWLIPASRDQNRSPVTRSTVEKSTIMLPFLCHFSIKSVTLSIFMQLVNNTRIYNSFHPTFHFVALCYDFLIFAAAIALSTESPHNLPTHAIIFFRMKQCPTVMAVQRK